jgi:hypothetical protein
VDALAAQTRIALDAGFTPPERVLTDLRGRRPPAARRPARGTLRGLLAETLARRGDLAAALGGRCARRRRTCPRSAAAFTTLALALLGRGRSRRAGRRRLRRRGAHGRRPDAGRPEADAARRAVAGR